MEVRTHEATLVVVVVSDRAQQCGFEPRLALEDVGRSARGAREDNAVVAVGRSLPYTWVGNGQVRLYLDGCRAGV